MPPPLVTVVSGGHARRARLSGRDRQERGLRGGDRDAAGRGPHHRAAFSGRRAAQEGSAALHDRSAAVPGAARRGGSATGAEPRGARSGQHATEDVRQIADTKAVSQLDYETKKNTVDVDQAQVQAAEAAVENAKLNLDYCHIRSPIDGRAGARLVDVGNVVQANIDGAAIDPAARSDLRRLHDHRKRSARGAPGDGSRAR